MFSEINGFLASAVLALFLGLFTSALQLGGVISVNLARVLLFAAWAVAVVGASSSLNNAPPEHRAITAAIIGIPIGLALILTERWIVNKRRNVPLVQTTAEKRLEPNIICLAEDDLFVTLDRHEIFRETEDYGPGALRAATVKFTNEPKLGRKVRSVNNVRAQIIYYDSDWPEREAYRIDYGCWLNEESPYVSFNLSDNAVQQLIVVAFQHKKDGGYGFERKVTIYGNSPDRNAPLIRYGYNIVLVLGSE